MDSERFTVAVETRASADGPRLYGTVLQEGRAATGGRAEVWAPGAMTWPATGIALRASHLGEEIGRAVPTREPNGEIHIEAPASPAIMAAVRDRPYLSVEFYPLREIRTAARVREIQLAVVDGAAFVDTPEYQQARAEVREARRRVWL